MFRRSRDGKWIGVVDLGYAADGKRRRRTVTANTQTLARQRMMELRKQVEANGGDFLAPAMTVEAWLRYWLDTIQKPQLRPKTWQSYNSDVQLHIVPVVGRHKLTDLAPQHVRALHKAILDKGRSSTSALRCHWTLSGALGDAMREGHVPRNVCELVKPPAKARTERPAMDAATAIEFLSHVADDPLGARWATALFTGARQGEVLGLERDRVSDVLDLSWQLQRLTYRHGCKRPCWRVRAGSCPDRELDVPPGFDHRPLTGGLVLSRPKTRAGHRVVPLVDPLAGILLRHVSVSSPGPFNLVWSTATGQPIDPRDDSKAWHDALDGAGLPSMPLHSARHTTGTLLLAAGVDIKVIEAIMGHSSAAVSRGYMHTDRRMLVDALNRMSRVLEG